MFQCPAYLHLREKYVSTESVGQPNWSNVRNILACENEPKTINLSEYLTFALNIRKKEIRATMIFQNGLNCTYFGCAEKITVGGPFHIF